jgi:hypothetical protein
VLVGHRIATPLFTVAAYKVGCLGLTAIIWNLQFAHYDKFAVEAYLWLLPSVVCDIAITATLVWYLVGVPQCYGAARSLADLSPRKRTGGAARRPTTT